VAQVIRNLLPRPPSFNPFQSFSKRPTPAPRRTPALEALAQALVPLVAQATANSAQTSATQQGQPTATTAQTQQVQAYQQAAAQFGATNNPPFYSRPNLQQKPPQRQPPIQSSPQLAQQMSSMFSAESLQPLIFQALLRRVQQQPAAVSNQFLQRMANSGETTDPQEIMEDQDSALDQLVDSVLSQPDPLTARRTKRSVSTPIRRQETLVLGPHPIMDPYKGSSGRRPISAALDQLLMPLRRAILRRRSGIKGPNRRPIVRVADPIQTHKEDRPHPILVGTEIRL